MTQLDTPHGTVAIRTACEDDAAAYRALRIEALRTVPTAFGSDVASAEARTLEQWRQQMRGGSGEGDTRTGVAEAEGALVAMTTFVQETGSKLQHQANIYGVYVHPNWRGAGILDALMAQGTAWAKQRNVRLLKLSVSANNTAAMRAYTRHGFQVYGIDPEAVLWEGVFYNELLMYRRVE